MGGAIIYSSLLKLCAFLTLSYFPLSPRLSSSDEPVTWLLKCNNASFPGLCSYPKAQEGHLDSQANWLFETSFNQGLISLVVVSQSSNGYVISMQGNRVFKIYHMGFNSLFAMWREWRTSCSFTEKMLTHHIFSCVR